MRDGRYGPATQFALSLQKPGLLSRKDAEEPRGQGRAPASLALQSGCAGPRPRPLRTRSRGKAPLAKPRPAPPLGPGRFRPPPPPTPTWGNLQRRGLAEGGDYLWAGRTRRCSRGLGAASDTPGAAPSRCGPRSPAPSSPAASAPSSPRRPPAELSRLRRERKRPAGVAAWVPRRAAEGGAGGPRRRGWPAGRRLAAGEWRARPADAEGMRAAARCGAAGVREWARASAGSRCRRGLLSHWAVCVCRRRRPRDGVLRLMR